MQQIIISSIAYSLSNNSFGFKSADISVRADDTSHITWLTSWPDSVKVESNPKIDLLLSNASAAGRVEQAVYLAPREGVPTAQQQLNLGVAR